MSRTNSGRSLQDSAREAGNTGGNMLESVQQLGKNAGAAVQEGYENLRDNAGEYVRQGKKTVMQWEKALEETVQDKPIYSLLIALGAGMVIGYLCKQS